MNNFLKKAFEVLNKEVKLIKDSQDNIYFIYNYIKKTNDFNILKYVTQEKKKYIIYHILLNIDLYKTSLVNLFNYIFNEFDILSIINIDIILKLYNNTELFKIENNLSLQHEPIYTDIIEETTILDYLKNKLNILIFNIEEILPYNSEDYTENDIQEIIKIFVEKFNNKTIIFFDINKITAQRIIPAQKRLIIYKNNVLFLEKNIVTNEKQNYYNSLLYNLYFINYNSKYLYYSEDELYNIKNNYESSFFKSYKSLDLYNLISLQLKNDKEIILEAFNNTSIPLQLISKTINNNSKPLQLISNKLKYPSNKFYKDKILKYPSQKFNKSLRNKFMN
jgi:hypothetical protein